MYPSRILMYLACILMCPVHVHAGYMQDMKDTCRIHQDTYCIGTPPSPVRPPLGRAGLLRAGGGEDHQERAPTQVLRAALDRLPVDSVSAVNAGSMLGRVPRLVSAAF